MRFKWLKTSVLVTFVFLLMPCLFNCGVSAAQQVYTVGVVPQFGSVRTAEIWQPILEKVSKSSGVHLQLKASPSIPEFEKQFESGEFDFAYMNPYHLIVANKKAGYLPLVCDVGRKLFGIIVVKKDSPLKSVKELDGKTVAFPSPNALGAALLPRTEFKKIYHIKVNELYVKSHSSVYLNVLLGHAVAGGGVQKTLSQQPKDIQEQLRVLYKTAEVPSHPFVGHPRVNKNVKAKVTAAFLELGSSKSGNELLEKVPFKKIGKTTIKDYNVLKNMDLSGFYIKK